MFSRKQEDLGDEVGHFMDSDWARLGVKDVSHFGKGPKHDCNFWIWSVEVNDQLMSAPRKPWEEAGINTRSSVVSFDSPLSPSIRSWTP